MSEELEKLAALADPSTEVTIGGLKLRPFTAASLTFMQLVKNPLLDQRSESEGVPDVVFHLSSFIYLHAEELKKVYDSTRNPDTYRDAVLAFAQNVSVQDIIASSEVVARMISTAMVGKDYKVDHAGTTDSPPN